MEGAGFLLCTKLKSWRFFGIAWFWIGWLNRCVQLKNVLGFSLHSDYFIFGFVETAHKTFLQNSVTLFLLFGTSRPWFSYRNAKGRCQPYYPVWEIPLSRLIPNSPNEDTNRPQSPTPPILSWLRDTFVPIDTQFSQWGYQQTSITNTTFYTILIERYLYPN